MEESGAVYMEVGIDDVESLKTGPINGQDSTRLRYVVLVDRCT